MSDIPNPETLTRQPGVMGRGGVEPPAEPEQAVTPEQALEEQKQRLADAERREEAERQRAQQAARERDEARQRAAEAGTQALTAQEQALDTTIKAQEAAVTQAKTAIANAQAAGDTVALTEAIEQMTAAKANIIALNGRKEWLAAQKQQPRQEQRSDPEVIRVRTPGGEINAAPAAKQWMDGHSRFYNDPAYYNHAVAAHSTIVADGITEGSPAYFRALDAAMDQFEQFEAFQRGELRQEPRQEQRQMNGQQQRPRASSMGAPVSRTSAPVQRDGTPDPVSIARHIGRDVTVDDLKEMARVNGYSARRYGDEAKAFAAYLKDQQEIIELQRAGMDTGLKVDGVYR